MYFSLIYGLGGHFHPLLELLPALNGNPHPVGNIEVMTLSFLFFSVPLYPPLPCGRDWESCSWDQTTWNGNLGFCSCLLGWCFRQGLPSRVPAPSPTRLHLRTLQPPLLAGRVPRVLPMVHTRVETGLIWPQNWTMFSNPSLQLNAGTSHHHSVLRCISQLLQTLKWGGQWCFWVSVFPSFLLAFFCKDLVGFIYFLFFHYNWHLILGCISFGCWLNVFLSCTCAQTHVIHIVPYLSCYVLSFCDYCYSTNSKQTKSPQ